MTNTLDASLAVVILAAGQGTRMRSSLPKVLHRIGGRPLVGHVLDTARDLAPGHVLVVVRHERDAVADALAVAEGAAESLGVSVTDTESGETFSVSDFRKRFGS